MSRIRHQHYQPVVIESGSQIADLFSPPFQSVNTSEAAAARIKPSTAQKREAIFQFIQAQGGATDGEIAQGLGMNPSTVRPRRRELEGNAPWCKGRLRARIVKTPQQRNGMRVYRSL